MKVSPERTRRYLRRTLTRPESSYTVTEKERGELVAWDEAFIRNLEQGPAPAAYQWMAAVKKYAEVKGIRTRFTVRDNLDGSSTVRWEEERHD